MEDGWRESAQSWRELLLRLRDENGLVQAPELATGDGALGFWQALHQVWPGTRQQRCWFHKMGNVLNVLPKALHGKAKQDLHAIYEAENRQEAEAAFERFVSDLPTGARLLCTRRISAVEWVPLDQWTPVEEAILAKLCAGDYQKYRELTAEIVSADFSGVYRVFLKVPGPGFMLRK